MNKYQTWALVLLRVAFGWMFLYAGYVKITDPDWSALDFIQGASTFPDFYAFFTKPDILPIVDFLNEWGLALIGVSLIVGVLVRFSASIGAVVMLLYYFPVLAFPYAGGGLYIVDEHIIYALGLVVLALFDAGKYMSLAPRLQRLVKGS